MLETELLWFQTHFILPDKQARFSMLINKKGVRDRRKLMISLPGMLNHHCHYYDKNAEQIFLDHLPTHGEHVALITDFITYDTTGLSAFVPSWFTDELVICSTAGRFFFFHHHSGLWLGTA